MRPLHVMIENKTREFDDNLRKKRKEYTEQRRDTNTKCMGELKVGFPRAALSVCLCICLTVCLHDDLCLCFGFSDGNRAHFGCLVVFPVSLPVYVFVVILH